MQPLPFRSILILHGGWSAERDVSLVSGRAAHDALKGSELETVLFDLRRDNVFELLDIMRDAAKRPDFIFNALHGHGGEDGVIQGFAATCGIPMSHSGTLASALAMNKPMAKVIMSNAGVPVAYGQVVTKDHVLKNGWPLEPPFVIKPVDDGSSVGVRLVLKNGDNNDPSQEQVWQMSDRALVERYIPGHELTVTVMIDRDGTASPLAVTELISNEAFYDYTAKYTSGITEHVLPARIPADIYDQSMRISAAACIALGCRGMSRVDLRWDDKYGVNGLYVLEVNTQPGLTPLSLAPEQAKHVGMSFTDLILWMINNY